MLNVDSQDWWMWQMYRATAEFMQNPSDSREDRLKFFMNSYRDFHQQKNTNDLLTNSHKLQSPIAATLPAAPLDS